MPVNVKNFVDINIQKQAASTIAGSRDTAVLFTSSTIPNGDKTYTEYVSGDITGTDATKTIEYVNAYFRNGGVKLRVIHRSAALAKADITALDDEFICIASVGTTLAQMKTIAEAMNSDTTIYGVNEKLLFVSTDDDSSIDTSSVKNLIVQYSGNFVYEQAGQTTVYDDSSVMSIMAYLSQINVYSAQSVFDYMFTEVKKTPRFSIEDIDNSTYQSLIAANYNVNIELANAVRATGGNCKNGFDLVNEYVRIILHQTLTERLLEQLTQKLKTTDTSSKVYTTIASELNRYLASGYLTTDKIYADNDWTVTRDNAEYLICEKGTALPNGYIVKILPFLSEDFEAHKTPPIYILLADQVGIRKITISGQVI